ncbi:hypothetical protein [Paenibacillus sp. FJAT-27812]|uniref:hypothetical protein n=1 Tax=Paenibacillus sp. FJAT-27812 TaxID=1684143 RepID=UPI0006A77901|nr:hypothetical protein [Paenibacillus sp. FJAT-27812]
MSMDTKDRNQVRVELVMDIIKGICEIETIPEAVKAKLDAMSYDDLGVFLMDIVKKRSIDEIL